MQKSKILFISQEIAPYLPSTPISEIGRLVPQAMHEKGYEVRTFMPRYGMINERRNQLHEVIRLSGINLVIDDSDHPLIIKVASILPSRMQVYFIDGEDYFHRGLKSKETENSKEDNDERMIFFTRGVLETVRRLRWKPTIVQCSGWLTALVALYIRNKMADDPSFRNVKIIYTLLDDRFEGTLDLRFVEKLIADGFEEDLLEGLSGKNVGYDELTRFAINNSDAVIQARENVDRDLLLFANESGKPFVTYPGEENLIQAHQDLYETLAQILTTTTTI